VTITSPLEGHLDFSNVLDWVSGRAVKPEFIPRCDFLLYYVKVKLKVTVAYLFPFSIPL
jgi:hypothetical protein